MLKKIALSLVILLGLGYIWFCWSLSKRVLTTGSSLELTQQRIRDNWGMDFDSLMSEMPTPETFSFSSYDDTKIVGQYFSVSDSNECMIIMAHGWSDTWAGMLRYPFLFEECGCDMVLYDHRGHGQSDPVHPTAGIREGKDLVALTHYLSDKEGIPLDHIGWVGTSWGGASVLHAGSDSLEVAFIIADSPFSDWYSAIFERAEREYGVIASWIGPSVMSIVNMLADVDYHDANTVLAAKAVQEPVLLIHSAGDSETSSLQSVQISKQLNDRSTFHHTQWGSDHTRDILQRPVEYKAMVTQFLQTIPTFKGCQ